MRSIVAYKIWHHFLVDNEFVTVNTKQAFVIQRKIGDKLDLLFDEVLYDLEKNYDEHRGL